MLPLNICLRSLCRLYESLKTRLATVERSLATLDRRVTGIESSGVGDLSADGSSAQPLHQTTPIPVSSGLEVVDGGSTNSKDPTDGIGSMTFTKEEESGFFGTNWLRNEVRYTH